MKMRFLTMWAGSVLDANITIQSFRYQDENAGICFTNITKQIALLRLLNLSVDI